MIFNPNTGKYGPEITPYLDTFQAVFLWLKPQFIASITLETYLIASFIRRPVIGI